MLQTQTVEPYTLALLKELIVLDVVADFNLAGGTALALQIGHRTSTDLDFFGDASIDFDIIKKNISANYDYKIQVDTKNILIGFINGVKVDFVRYKYPLLHPILDLDSIRMLSIEDIACMELAAITGRGKKRDFFDLYCILKKYSLAELIQFYQEKYYDGSIQLVLKSLTYFVDAEEDELPRLFEKITWNEVKDTIQKQFLDYYNTL